MRLATGCMDAGRAADEPLTWRLSDATGCGRARACSRGWVDGVGFGVDGVAGSQGRCAQADQGLRRRVTSPHAVVVQDLSAGSLRSRGEPPCELQEAVPRDGPRRLQGWIPALLARARRAADLDRDVRSPCTREAAVEGGKERDQDQMMRGMSVAALIAALISDARRRPPDRARKCS
jgi:hypothetical protein